MQKARKIADFALNPLTRSGEAVNAALERALPSPERWWASGVEIRGSVSGTEARAAFYRSTSDARFGDGSCETKTVHTCEGPGSFCRWKKDKCIPGTSPALFDSFVAAFDPKQGPYGPSDQEAIRLVGKSLGLKGEKATYDNIVVKLNKLKELYGWAYGISNAGKKTWIGLIVESSKKNGGRGTKEVTTVLQRMQFYGGVGNLWYNLKGWMRSIADKGDKLWTGIVVITTLYFSYMYLMPVISPVLSVAGRVVKGTVVGVRDEFLGEGFGGGPVGDAAGQAGIQVAGSSASFAPAPGTIDISGRQDTGQSAPTADVGDAASQGQLDWGTVPPSDVGPLSGEFAFASNATETGIGSDTGMFDEADNYAMSVIADTGAYVTETMAAVSDAAFGALEAVKEGSSDAMEGLMEYVGQFEFATEVDENEARERFVNEVVARAGTGRDIELPTGPMARLAETLADATPHTERAAPRGENVFDLHTAQDFGRTSQNDSQDEEMRQTQEEAKLLGVVFVAGVGMYNAITRQRTDKFPLPESVVSLSGSDGSSQKEERRLLAVIQTSVADYTPEGKAWQVMPTPFDLQQLADDLFMVTDTTGWRALLMIPTKGQRVHYVQRGGYAFTHVIPMEDGRLAGIAIICPE